MFYGLSHLLNAFQRPIGPKNLRVKCSVHKLDPKNLRVKCRVHKADPSVDPNLVKLALECFTWCKNSLPIFLLKNSHDAQ
jgi:hypothetical protein